MDGIDFKTSFQYDMDKYFEIRQQAVSLDFQINDKMDKINPKRRCPHFKYKNSPFSLILKI